MPQTLLTDLAVRLIRNAAGSNSMVAITHVALGDGLGAKYTPVHSQTALKRERARVQVERRIALGNDSWRVVAEFPPETDAFQIREMGFFDAAGNLIALWAGLDVEPRQTGVITYIVEHILNFSRVENGLVIVDAPDDEFFDFAVAMLASQASQDLLIFNLQQKIGA